MNNNCNVLVVYKNIKHVFQLKMISIMSFAKKVILLRCHLFEIKIWWQKGLYLMNVLIYLQKITCIGISCRRAI